MKTATDSGERRVHPARGDIVLSVRDVSKVYRLYERPQDRIKHMFLWRFGKSYGRDFWALRDISLDVSRGETLGILGRNGAGKSTLLQILAGILRPTTGQVRVSGRVAALLELGSGFHPEFTGRENIFLNGAIWGLTTDEIHRHLDDIIAFADIGEFIDQPVKTYSAGMFMRLAFAITVGIRADVLLIDELLAVGDIFFRQKCFRRLEQLRGQGVTIVLVSHNPVDVEQFCTRAILLDHGRVVFDGPAVEAVKMYYLIEQEGRVPPSAPAAESRPEPDLPWDAQPAFWPDADAFLDLRGFRQVSNGWARCTAVALCNAEGRPCNVFLQGDVASFFYEFELLRDIEVPIGGLVIQNDRGILVHGKNTLQYETPVPHRVPAGSRLRFRQDIRLNVAVGEYSFEVGLATLPYEDYKRRAWLPHPELREKIVRLCHVPRLGPFTVTFRKLGTSVQLPHHGLADLPGHCVLSVLPPPGSHLDDTG